MKEVIINSAEEMIELGATIGKSLSAGAVVAMVGDLGAGKTHFTKGLCRSQGGNDTTSPTFKLVNEIPGKPHWVFHFDFYRVKAVEELLDLGWDDYLDREGVVVAEWADLYPELIPEEALWIKIEHVSEGRKVIIAQ